MDLGKEFFTEGFWRQLLNAELHILGKNKARTSITQFIAVGPVILLHLSILSAAQPCVCAQAVGVKQALQAQGKLSVFLTQCKHCMSNEMKIPF